MWPEIRIALERLKRERESAERRGPAASPEPPEPQTGEQPTAEVSARAPCVEPFEAETAAPAAAGRLWAARATELPVGLMALDSKLRVLEANPPSAALLGLDPQDPAGTSLLECVAEADRQQLRRHLPCAPQEGEAQAAPARCELTMRTPDASQRRVLLLAHALAGTPADTPAAPRWLAAVIDMSSDSEERSRLHRHVHELERRILQRALEATRLNLELTDARRQYEQLVQHLDAIHAVSTDAIMTTDRRGVIRSFNPSSERMFGLRRSEAIGEPLSILLAPAEVERIEALFRLDPATGASQEGSWEFRACHRNGHSFPIDLTLREVDHLGVFVCITRDLSERKELQRHMLEIAENEKRAIGQELHDSIGQQLTGLKFYAEMLAQSLTSKGLPEAEQAAKLQAILAEAGDQVRELSHGLMPAIVSGEALPEALEQLARRLDYADHLSCEFACEQPGITAGLSAGTATQLYRIVQEAAQNAVRHSGGDRIRISLNANDEDLCVEVTDNGTGIAPDCHRRDNGGMAIMKYRAALIGGWLEIEPLFDGGTRMRCRLKRTS